MRFWWQLTTRLSQIGEHELVAGVGDTKLLTVRALIDALRCSPEAVDRWIETTTERFPVVHDRGWSLAQTPPSLADRAQEHQVVRRPPGPRPPDPVAVPRLNDEELARAQAACRAGAEGAAMRLGEVLEGRGDLKNAEAAYRLAGKQAIRRLPKPSGGCYEPRANRRTVWRRNGSTRRMPDSMKLGEAGS